MLQAQMYCIPLKYTSHAQLWSPNMFLVLSVWCTGGLRPVFSLCVSVAM